MSRFFPPTIYFLRADAVLHGEKGRGEGCGGCGGGGGGAKMIFHVLQWAFTLAANV